MDPTEAFAYFGARVLPYVDLRTDFGFNVVFGSLAAFLGVTITLSLSLIYVKRKWFLLDIMDPRRNYTGFCDRCEKNHSNAHKDVNGDFVALVHHREDETEQDAAPTVVLYFPNSHSTSRIRDMVNALIPKGKSTSTKDAVVEFQWPDSTFLHKSASGERTPMAILSLMSQDVKRVVETLNLPKSSKVVLYLEGVMAMGASAFEGALPKGTNPTIYIESPHLITAVHKQEHDPLTDCLLPKQCARLVIVAMATFSTKSIGETDAYFLYAQNHSKGKVRVLIWADLYGTRTHHVGLFDNISQPCGVQSGALMKQGMECLQEGIHARLLGCLKSLTHE